MHAEHEHHALECHILIESIPCGMIMAEYFYKNQAGKE